jgi:hypothetical protein
VNIRAKKRIEKLIEYHELEDPKLTTRTSLELGEVHQDVLNRVSIILGMSKTAVIRMLLDYWIEETRGGFLVISDPNMLYSAVENGDL